MRPWKSTVQEVDIASFGTVIVGLGDDFEADRAGHDLLEEPGHPTT